MKNYGKEKNVTSRAASERCNSFDHMRQTYLPVYLLHTQTCTYISSVHDKRQNTSHRLKRSEIFFHPERDKALPE